jgi:hypothetical protein
LQRIDAERREVDLDRYRGAFADLRHVSTVTEGDVVVHLAGAEQPSVVYVELAERLPEAVAALRSIRFQQVARTGGMKSTSRTFGYAPAKVLRREETCQAAVLAKEAPREHAIIAGLASVVEREYLRWNAEQYEHHEEVVSKVLPDWRLAGGVFTSGIINRNNKLPYHYDAGNFADCWSNMLVFKYGCVGGDLVCPELDLAFRLRDHSLLMFDGQSILHGVSPFRLIRRDGYRYSVVFYSLQQMWRCDPKVDSVRLAAERLTKRERERFQHHAEQQQAALRHRAREQRKKEAKR